MTPGESWPCRPLDVGGLTLTTVDGRNGGSGGPTTGLGVPSVRRSGAQRHEHIPLMPAVRRNISPSLREPRRALAKQGIGASAIARKLRIGRRLCVSRVGVSGPSRVLSGNKETEQALPFGGASWKVSERTSVRSCQFRVSRHRNRKQNSQACPRHMRRGVGVAPISNGSTFA